MASTRIYRTMGSPTNDKIWTISGWFKLSKSSGHLLFASDANNNTSWTQITFSSDRLHISAYDTAWLTTNRVFRDRNAWYHIVITQDSTQSTAADRIKLYVNGVQETSFATDNRASTSLNQSWGWNKNGVVNNIGGENASGYGDFLLSHFHNIDGTAYDASAFGETDSTTGEWKIKTAPSVTYGNNGFFWLKDSVATTDHSPNSNTFTIGGTLTKTEDCPSNVFATLNSLVTTASTPSFSQGNNTVSPSAGAYQNHFSTIGMTGGGKYYWEMKVNGSPNSANYHGVSSDIELNNLITVSNIVGYTSTGYSLVASSGNKYNNTNSSSYGSALADGDIMMGALDLDNGKIWFGKNGAWFNSGNPASGTNEAFSSISASNTYFPSGTVYNGGFSSINFNFGNGYFGTTAVSSAGTNASNIGIFEYDVPAGFTALSTKGLNSF